MRANPGPEVIERSKTAMSRAFLSRPLQQALEDGLLSDRSVFDYGCGRGGDIRQLKALGIDASGWDPFHFPHLERRRASVVNLGYVVNVIEDQRERREALITAWDLAEEVLVVSARLIWEDDLTGARPYGDGVITSSNTFQKFYTHEELKAWVEATLDGFVRTASPGVVYVFRSRKSEQQFLASQSRAGGSRRRAVAEILMDRHAESLAPLREFVLGHRRLPNPTDIETAAEIVETFGSIRDAFYVLRSASPTNEWPDIDLGKKTKSLRLFESNLEILQPLVDFLTDRGRLPRESEFPTAEAVVEEFGSIRQAYTLIRRVTGPEVWEGYASHARDNFLVYCALSAFGGRPKLSDLPDDLQADAKDLFGSYKSARQFADELLFSIADMGAINEACIRSKLGKLTPEALYVHVDYVPTLEPILRIYDGAARQLTGNVDDATLVKFNRVKPQVSYLVYPTFSKDPHPALKYSIVGKLGEGRMKHRSFEGRGNPPILHRKEQFLAETDPRWQKFSRLTKQEERAGLLDRSDIGTLAGWQAALDAAGYEVVGHRLKPTK